MDYRTAIFLAAVCNQAYLNTINADGSFLVPKSYHLVGEFSAQSYSGSNERFGFILQSEQAIILAFRGTLSATDWVADLIAQQVPYRFVKNGGATHKGFTDLYSSARDSILSVLETLPKDKPLFITGHSLGGALATLSALDIAVNKPFANPLVYTFGAPRVGDPAFVRTYNSQIGTHWRIQNEYDIVPHLPPLVYQQPNKDKTYYYMHVRGEVMRKFRMGTVSGNHVISSYFMDLAKEDPEFAAAVCLEPPGWCPIPDPKAAP
ncbi:lipase family protein [Paenibacillus protaetiae]|uniref:Lipase family protein n=2 Tax=Paenibacillus protaetiae TaxID=2509456 RepID=A0A4P6F5I3_9BACL|nr:lipase family protein [Paenibacillus protaetiae]